MALGKKTNALSASFRSEGLTLLDHFMSCTGGTSVGCRIQMRCVGSSRVVGMKQQRQTKIVAGSAI